jgi:hypothetical protein
MILCLGRLNRAGIHQTTHITIYLYLLQTKKASLLSIHEQIQKTNNFLKLKETQALLKNPIKSLYSQREKLVSLNKRLIF